jgi:hypothetical protein
MRGEIERTELARGAKSDPVLVVSHLDSARVQLPLSLAPQSRFARFPRSFAAGSSAPRQKREKSRGKRNPSLQKQHQRRKQTRDEDVEVIVVFESIALL